MTGYFADESVILFSLVPFFALNFLELLCKIVFCFASSMMSLYELRVIYLDSIIATSTSIPTSQAQTVEKKKKATKNSRANMSYSSSTEIVNMVKKGLKEHLGSFQQTINKYTSALLL